MKTRFTTVDIKAAVFELKERLLGLRVVSVYDVDSKTYLIKLAKPDKKEVLLIESGVRFHATDFEWPKSMMPSGFAMKMRKHLKSRRLEKIDQVGEDRIIDFQFGSGEAAYHVILELYDRGNLVLTDHEYLILNILRPRTDESQDVRFAVREKYPLECAKQDEGPVTVERLSAILAGAKEGDNLKKVLLPQFAYGPAVLDHCLLVSGLSSNAKIGKDISTTNDLDKLLAVLHLADSVVADICGGIPKKGYIVQKAEKSSNDSGMETSEILTYIEFHPYLFTQHSTGFPFVEFESFNKAVDEFFSKIESQKLDVKLLQQEKTALKKLENVKKDHLKRLEELQVEQSTDAQKAQLIEINLSLVDCAITVVRSLLASQLDWLEIEKLVNDASNQGDLVAGSIKSLKLQSNHITMLLQPQGVVATRDDSDSSDDETTRKLKPSKIDIDLGFSAYANARKYFDMKRHAHQKQQKTINASEKALKSAERKTKQTLKEVKTVATIIKARKTYWFEKFLWFISSENYMIIGGRDQQQNEMLVKRYFKQGDLYVHADLHGASSIIIKNPTKEPVPPKTLNEAGTMALCYSAAWEARVVTSAWWVHHDQVSKTAPSGEYLTTGSFMIRGKKNYLTPSHLIYGFGFLFKIDESCVPQHRNERRIRTLEDDDELLKTRGEEQSSVDDTNVASGSKNDDGNEDKVSEDQEVADNDDSESQDSQSDCSQEEDSSQDADNVSLEGDEAADYDDVNSLSVHNVKLENVSNSCSLPDSSCNEITTGIKEVQVASNIGITECKNSGQVLSDYAAANTNSDDDDEFPDTSIRLQYMGGDKFAFQTSVKPRLQTGKDLKQDDDDDTRVYLGDDKPVILGDKGTSKPSGHLSAKQRREMKKSLNVHFRVPLTSNSEHNESQTNKKSSRQQQASAEKSSSATEKSQQVQPKRGQKSKLKKIQDKYADQDEEERQLRLQILASAGPQKVDNKVKKGKKGKEAKAAKSALQKQQQQAAAQQRNKGPRTVGDIMEETPIMADGETVKSVLPSEDQTTAADLDDEDDSAAVTQDAAILDSLTGIPLPDDIILFCVPVCAPYSALTSYRYKVKLTPGTSKRGKAAKMSLDMFLHDKSSTQREKDLFRSVKDADLSRNMPGKVKVSAPNLHRQKHK